MAGLKLNMTLNQAIKEIAGKDRRARRDLSCLVRHHEQINPNDRWREFGLLLKLQSLEILGQKITKLFHDICDGDPVLFGVCMQAVDQKLITKDQLHQAISGQISINTHTLQQQLMSQAAVIKDSDIIIKKSCPIDVGKQKRREPVPPGKPKPRRRLLRPIRFMQQRLG